jgi:hypothetical protein
MILAYAYANDSRITLVTHNATGSFQRQLRIQGTGSRAIEPCVSGQHYFTVKNEQSLENFFPLPNKLSLLCFGRRSKTAHQRPGTALQRLGTVQQRLGTALQRLGTALQRLGTALQRVGTALQRLGTALQRFVL